MNLFDVCLYQPHFIWLLFRCGVDGWLFHSFHQYLVISISVSIDQTTCTNPKRTQQQKKCIARAANRPRNVWIWYTSFIYLYNDIFRLQQANKQMVSIVLTVSFTSITQHPLVWALLELIFKRRFFSHWYWLSGLCALVVFFFNLFDKYRKFNWKNEVIIWNMLYFTFWKVIVDLLRAFH